MMHSEADPQSGVFGGLRPHKDCRDAVDGNWSRRLTSLQKWERLCVDGSSAPSGVPHSSGAMLCGVTGALLRAIRHFAV